MKAPALLSIMDTASAKSLHFHLMIECSRTVVCAFVSRLELSSTKVGLTPSSKI